MMYTDQDIATLIAESVDVDALPRLDAASIRARARVQPSVGRRMLVPALAAAAVATLAVGVGAVRGSESRLESPSVALAGSTIPASGSCGAIGYPGVTSTEAAVGNQVTVRATLPTHDASAKLVTYRLIVLKPGHVFQAWPTFVGTPEQKEQQLRTSPVEGQVADTLLTDDVPSGGDVSLTFTPTEAGSYTVIALVEVQASAAECASHANPAIAGTYVGHVIVG